MKLHFFDIKASLNVENCIKYPLAIKTIENNGDSKRSMPDIGMFGLNSLRTKPMSIQNFQHILIKILYLLT